jgi:hypothetical protein
VGSIPSTIVSTPTKAGERLRWNPVTKRLE